MNAWIWFDGDEGGCRICGENRMVDVAAVGQSVMRGFGFGLADSFLRDRWSVSVDVRRFDVGRAVETHIFPAEIVGDDVDDVGFLVGGLS